MRFFKCDPDGISNGTPARINQPGFALSQTPAGALSLSCEGVFL